jgi:hypothetical protein
MTLDGIAGENSYGFDGVLPSGGKLKAGSYTVKISAASPNPSYLALSFTVVK